jgi:glycosyltransferase involved in cell wall biosynthesis
MSLSGITQAPAAAGPAAAVREEAGPRIVFVWDNLGPTHADRIDAVGEALPAQVIGVELYGRSSEYEWVGATGTHSTKITLAEAQGGRARITWRLLRALWKLRPQVVFFGHYERPGILLAATLCRLTGRRVLTMNDSKFDDYQRSFWREALKRLFVLPYGGALAGSRRSADYLRFLGVPADRIRLGYDAISAGRMRRLAGSPPAPEGATFADRHFTIVARLLPKKNITTALRAFALARAEGCERRLVVCGSGELEGELRQLSARLGLDEVVEFRGFVQSPAVAATLARTLALLLPSTEEQFGQAIAEAIALGVPVLVSDNCGARDTLVRTAVNGFVVEPDNVEGIAGLLCAIAADEALWRRLSVGCARFVEEADVGRFVDGVARLAGLTPPGRTG